MDIVCNGVIHTQDKLLNAEWWSSMLWWGRFKANQSQVTTCYPTIRLPSGTIYIHTTSPPFSFSTCWIFTCLYEPYRPMGKWEHALLHFYLFISIIPKMVWSQESRVHKCATQLISEVRSNSFCNEFVAFLFLFVFWWVWWTGQQNSASQYRECQPYIFFWFSQHFAIMSSCFAVMSPQIHHQLSRLKKIVTTCKGYLSYIH